MIEMLPSISTSFKILVTTKRPQVARSGPKNIFTFAFNDVRVGAHSVLTSMTSRFCIFLKGVSSLLLVIKL